MEATWISGRSFGGEVIARIAEAVEAEPELSRRQLSRRVCEWLDWRTQQGKPQEVGCRKALLELERRGVLRLPARREGIPVGRGEKKADVRPVAATFRGSLEELGEIEVVPISSRYSQDSKLWNTLMDQGHYLGAGPLCGAQIRYLVRSPTQGLLGGLAFSSATRQLKDREKWIGWSEPARRGNLSRVVCNSRFMIAMSVDVGNLASHVLALAMKRLSKDWQARYGQEPVLVETFVDPARFSGTSYRAANWQFIGTTAGRARGFSNGTISTGPKNIYVYPLRADYKSILCQKPEDPLALRSVGESWVEEEFGGARVYDAALRSRLYRLAMDFAASPRETIPEACGGSEAKTKAAYRFFANPRVHMRELLRGHTEATARRIQDHDVVLAVQDTTSINYTNHLGTEGLGPISTNQHQANGLILHDTIAFSLAGTPLGVLDAQCWARDPEEPNKARSRKNRPIEEKESIKWLNSYDQVAEVQRLCPKTMLVSVGDRESDIHDFFHHAANLADGPKLLVRADRGRQRKTISPGPPEELEYLWDRLRREPAFDAQTVHIPQKGARRARDAKLEIRFAQVVLKPPVDSPLDPVSVFAVLASEVDPSADIIEPLEWMLLSTVPVETFEDATKIVHWYTLRWGIEVYHRVLKSGCRIEDRRLAKADRLENCLAIDMVVAWRLFWLTKSGRETPNVPCDIILAEAEWKALYAVSTNAPLPESPPPLGDAIRKIAKLGGFLERNGKPGTTTMWRGFTRLEAIAVGFAAALKLTRERDGP